MHFIEEILSPGNRILTQEEWLLRIRWAYALGFRDGTHDTLSRVENTRAEASQHEDGAFRNVMRYLEEQSTPMSECRTKYHIAPRIPLVTAEELRDAEERAYWLTVLNALNTQKAGIEQQAAAIRKRLGLEERGRK